MSQAQKQNNCHCYCHYYFRYYHHDHRLIICIIVIVIVIVLVTDTFTTIFIMTVIIPIIFNNSFSFLSLVLPLNSYLLLFVGVAGQFLLLFFRLFTLLVAVVEYLSYFLGHTH